MEKNRVYTTRNLLRFDQRPEKRNMIYAPSLDTLYEMADAELNSEKKIHAEFHRLKAKHKTFRKSFIRFIRPYVLKINQRVILGIYEDDITVVCNRIYNDWIKNHGQDEPA